MNIQETIKRLEKEASSTKQTVESNKGLLRLQQVMEVYNGADKLISSEELIEKMQNRPPEVPFLTGVKSLDELTGGFLPKQLITVSAHSKHGKTSFGMFLLEKFATANPVAILLEQSAEEVIEQRLANKYSVPHFLLPETLPARKTVKWLEERIVEGIAKYNTKVVVIDHLGYVDDFGENNRFAKENLAYRIQMVMQGLKNIAKTWNVTIILMVHISQGDEGKPPQNEDLKGSSGILQESDKVIFLWRKNTLKNKIRVYEDKTMIYITANRRTGRNGYIGMKFDVMTGQFVEDNDWVEKMKENATLEAKADDDFDNV